MVFPATDGDNATKLLTLIEPVTLVTESLVSGTGVQLSTAAGAMLVLDITGGSAGTVKIELSADGVTYTTVVPATAANAVASHGRTVRVPIGYFVKVTVAVATIASAVAILD